MASSPQSPFSLRPWPTGDKKPKSLAEFIARLNATPNGFRDVTEENLRKEIEAEENGALNDEMSVDSEDAADPTTATFEEIRSARDELIKNSDIVHQNAVMALDSISLLLSKELPVQAASTMSPMLRDFVGIGTLGAEKLAIPNKTAAALQDSKLVSAGWKLDDISRTADSVLSSAARLQKEISLETRYWAEVLAVSERGWSVSRMPTETHTLGVKLGFSEATPIFRNNSIVPMRRRKDGRVELDTGRVGSSQRILVTIEKDGEVIGLSSMSEAVSQDAPLVDRVLEGRNTIFSQELWHELNREARNLLSYNVRLEESVVSCTIDDHTMIHFRLCAPDDDRAARESWGSRPEDTLAETLNIVLHVLLSHAHQQNNQKRSQPANLSATTTPGRPNQSYYLLRPLIAHLKHHKCIERATRFISRLTEVLRFAGIPEAAYTLTEPSILSPPSESNDQLPPSEVLVTSMLNPLEFTFNLTIASEVRLVIRARTTMSPAITTMWAIQLLPPTPARSAPLEGGNGAAVPQNPLQESYPPVESYPNLGEVIYYLRQAVARALADRFETLVLRITAPGYRSSSSSDTGSSPSDSPAADLVPVPRGWVKTIGGAGFTDLYTETREVRFQISTTGNERDDDMVHEAASGAVVDVGRHPPELRVFGAWYEGTKKVLRCWTWTVEDARNGVQREKLDEVVRKIVSKEVAPAR